MTDARTDTVSNWAHDMIMGVGGLLDFERYEVACNGCHDGHEHHAVEGFDPELKLWTDDQRASAMCWAAMWALECLVTPEYAGVLASANAEAKRKAGQT